MTRARYRAAVVGCGRMGVTMEEDPRRLLPATHAGAYRACPRTELVAVVDVDAERVAHATRLFSGVRGFTSVEAMLAAVHPEIVSAATPPGQHRAAVAVSPPRAVPPVISNTPLPNPPPH